MDFSAFKQNKRKEVAFVDSLLPLAEMK